MNEVSGRWTLGATAQRRRRLEGQRSNKRSHSLVLSQYASPTESTSMKAPSPQLTSMSEIARCTCVCVSPEQMSSSSVTAKCTLVYVLLYVIEYDDLYGIEYKDVHRS